MFTLFKKSKLTFCLIFICLAIVWVWLHSSISVRADGLTLVTPKVSFYIPSNQPTKVYVFNPHPPKLKEKVDSNIKNQQALFGIYIKNLSTGQTFSLNGKEQFTAASLYKLAVMYTIYHKASQNKLDITKAEIQNNLKSMITISSNEAAIFLVENYASWDEVTKLMQSIGLKNTSLNQLPPITTPEDIARLLELISEGIAVSPEASKAMLELLIAQAINDRIPVLLPAGVKVAHKTGELLDVRHDAGIVIGPDNNFILVLMSKGSPSPESVKPVMSNISLDIFKFFQDQWANPPEIL